MGSFGGRAADVLGVAIDTTTGWSPLAAGRRLSISPSGFLAATTEYEAGRAGVEILGANAADIAFAAVYVLEGQDQSAARCRRRDRRHDVSLWPLAEVARNGTPFGVEGLARSAERLGLPAASAPDKAVLVPLTSVGILGRPRSWSWAPIPCAPATSGIATSCDSPASRSRRHQSSPCPRRGAPRGQARGGPARGGRPGAASAGDGARQHQRYLREFRPRMALHVRKQTLHRADEPARRGCRRQAPLDLFPDLVDTPFHEAALRAVEENIITRVEYAYPIAAIVGWRRASIRPPTESRW